MLIRSGWWRPDGDIRPTAEEHLQHRVRAGVLLQVEFDIRELAAPAAQYRDENPRRHRLRAGDADAAADPGRHPPARQHGPIGREQGDPCLGDGGVMAGRS
jgi:hypothetical protein